jgi:hypothetical protein
MAELATPVPAAPSCDEKIPDTMHRDILDAVDAPVNIYMPAHYDPKKIKRLVVFGDSWTAGHGIETDIRYEEVARPEPFIERLRSHNAWCRWLADKMDLPFVNMGQPGICNAGIKRKIRENIHFCDPERDLIIVMLTYPYRHHLWMDTLDQDEIALKDIIDNIFSMLSGHNTFYCNAFCPVFRFEPDTSFPKSLQPMCCCITNGLWTYRCGNTTNDMSVRITKVSVPEITIPISAGTGS